MALRLATFNVKDLFSPRPSREDERDVVEAKVANLAANLRRAAADVVGLQEIGDVGLLARIVSLLPELGYEPPVLGAPDRRGIRNVILSRLPILWSQVHSAATLSFPSFAEGDPPPFAGHLRLRRSIVHVRVDAGDLGEVDVLTAHLKSNLPALRRTTDGEEIPDVTSRDRAESSVRSLVMRAAEALHLRGIVDDVLRALPDHAVCVMGDMNDIATSMPVGLVRGADLFGAFDRIPEDRRYSCFHGDRPTLIDHILLSERLHCAVSEVALFNEALRFHGPHVADVPLSADSDHALGLAVVGESHR